ncbi:MAG TPA: HAD-IA family hydrolase [Candidatus Saccharimonadales bacterium]|nr:HAD-IA family hydrolase [Candidatus Saccharimonadales bacterium]
MYQTQIKAIVFDSDGTLLDTRKLIVEGYKTVLKNHGLENLADSEYIVKRLGKPVQETYQQLLAGHHTGLKAFALTKEHDDVQDQLTHLIKPYTGLAEMLNHWKSMDIKLCLFTSGSRRQIDRNFNSAGIEHVDAIFDAIITADDQIARKPHPDTILELLRRVNVKPHYAMVVGDHMYDALGGHQAKVRLTVGILHGFGEAQELLSAGADVLVKDLFALNTIVNLGFDSPHAQLAENKASAKKV